MNRWNLVLVYVVGGAGSDAGRRAIDGQQPLRVYDAGRGRGQAGRERRLAGGTIVFEVVLALLTAGVANAASAGAKVLKAVLRVLDWTGEALGAAFRALKSFGGIILDIVKKLGNLVADAGGAALRAIKEALGSIGRKLVNFGEELLGRLSRVGDGAGTRAANNAAEEVGERAAREGAEDAAGRLAGESTEEAGERIARETMEDGGERAGRELGEEAGEKAAELPVAMAAASSICATNDAIDTPVPLLVG